MLVREKISILNDFYHLRVCIRFCYKITKIMKIIWGRRNAYPIVLFQIILLFSNDS